jgi:hypothetical protein
MLGKTLAESQRFASTEVQERAVQTLANLSTSQATRVLLLLEMLRCRRSVGLGQ